MGAYGKVVVDQPSTRTLQKCPHLPQMRNSSCPGAGQGCQRCSCDHHTDFAQLGKVLGHRSDIETTMATRRKRVHPVTLDDVESTGLPPTEALQFHTALQIVLRQCGHSPQDVWQRVSQDLLRPHHPFSLHRLLYYSTYADWDVSKRGPPIVWTPSKYFQYFSLRGPRH